MAKLYHKIINSPVAEIYRNGNIAQVYSHTRSVTATVVENKEKGTSKVVAFDSKTGQIEESCGHRDYNVYSGTFGGPTCKSKYYDEVKNV